MRTYRLAVSVVLVVLLLAAATSAQAATVVVTSRADSGGGSLREALLSVIPGDTITFDPAIFPPANPAAIRLLSALPDLTMGNLTIDASNAGVVLDGAYATAGTNGFRITSNGNSIKGMKIINFPNNGIDITNGAKNNTIGGDWTVGSAPHGEGNIITLNRYHGVSIDGAGTDNNTVSGNLIGLDADGTRDIRIRSIVISPNYVNDRTLFIGTKFHGVWKTTDAGDSWMEVNTGLTTLEVPALAVSPNYAADGTLFAGTAKDGIFRTTNGGGSWSRVDGGTVSDVVYAIAVSPAFATDRQVFAGIQCRGVFASTDGGSTWAARNSGLPTVCLDNLLISPNYSTDRTLFARGGDALYKSVNQGYGWTQVSSGAFNYALTLSISSNYTNDQTLFIGTNCNANAPVLKSTDGGLSWALSGDRDLGCHVYAVAVSPDYATDRTIFAAIQNGYLLKSTNGGLSWSNAAAINTNYTLAISPSYARDQTLYWGQLLGGVFKSVDGGSTGIEVSASVLTERGNANSGVNLSNGAQGNTIGGSSAGGRNVISRHGSNGIQIIGSGTTNNTISGNFIGTDASGMATLGNNDGVACWNGAHQNTIRGNIISGNMNNGLQLSGCNDGIITGNYVGINAAGAGKLGNGQSGVSIVNGSQNNRVGGATEAERNIISGNDSCGVSIANRSTSNNTIIGNHIGTNASGTGALGNVWNGIGFSDQASQNVVGGTTAGERNVISGNIGSGVQLDGCERNTIIGNYIGVDVTGAGRLGNGVSGIDIIRSANQNIIGGTAPGQANIIAYTSGNGIITLNSSIRNTFSRNSIYSNGYHGIDNQSGGNKELSPPALVANTATTVTGISPLPNVTIEVFSDAADEGRVYEGTVAADANGDFIFTKAGGFQGPYLTATATDGDGNTSEFSSPRTAVTTGTSYTLTVTKSGSGTGTVTSQPALISCGAACSGSFTASSTVTLTAAPDSNSTFGGWTGACTGTGSTCTVNMDAAKTVTAAFNPSSATRYQLSVTKAGSASGTVTSNPYGISCGTACSAEFSSAQSVILTAAAGSGAAFAGWSGACSGTGTCTLAMLSNKSVTATFNTVATDTSPPTNASIAINNGATSTGARQVSLTLSASDSSGMGQMRFSNDNANWSNPVSYASTYEWTLTTGDGLKTVYAKFSDSLGNWMGSAVSDTITLSTTIAPANPSGLTVVSTGSTTVTLRWDKNNDESTYHVFRSETEKGVFYRVNTTAIGEESFTWDSVLRAFKVNFTDEGLKEGRTYYYAVQAVSGGVTSTGLSTAVSARTETINDYTVTVLDPTNIVNVGSSAKYYIQLLPGDRFTGTVNLSCSGMPSGATYDFIVNGERKGASAAGLTPPASVVLEVLAGSSTQTGEHHFTLLAQNFWTGGSSDLRESSLALTVISRSGGGIHVEVAKASFRKGEKVKVYGSILPMEANKTVTLTVSGGASQTKNLSTMAGGKFEDLDWFSTLDVGSYTVSASWTDSQTNRYTSTPRTFIVMKGEPVLTCLRKTGETGVIGGDFTIMGSIKPVIAYAPLTLQVEDPDGVASRQSMTLDADGQYTRIDRFFTKNGIWKFRVYYEGNDDYIGAESNELVVSVGVEYGRAIILGGGVAEQSNTYWEATKKLTVAAYRDFKSKGFRNDMIYYLINSPSIDINYDEIPDNVVSVTTPTVSAFLDAVKNQYASALGLNTPLFIYLQGHGTTDGRLKVLGADQYLTAAEFKDALDYLQGVGKYAGRQGSVEVNVVILIEACYSGSFIATLSGPKRVILTSAGNEAYNTDASGQISFSRRLFAKLLEGENVKKAFDYARTIQVNMNYPAPHLDDNGDGVDNAADGVLATSLYLNGQLTWGMRPTIGTVTVTSLLDSGTSTPITVEVLKGDVNVEKVWVQIMAPNAAVTGGEGTISYPELELTRNATTGKYDATLAGLGVAGIYKLSILARDVNKEVSDPTLAYITVVGATPGDVNGDGAVTIADAVKALQITSGLETTGQTINTGADVNADGKLGLPEAIYILQKAAGAR